MQLERAKGTEDFPPEKKILRNEIIEKLKKVFERYGFNPLETPILERYSTLSAKYAGGSEILKETFRLKDQGNRELGLRYDLTVPLARFIAMNPQIGFPFKRYQIEKVFRDGPVTKARIREFWQCDVDIVGVKSLLADVEIIQLALDALKELGLECTIKINNRKLLNEIISSVNIKNDPNDVILCIDKLYKLGQDVVEKELKEKGVATEQIASIMSIITIKGSNKEKQEKLQKKIPESEGLQEIQEVLKYCKENVEFDITLARGLSYYTGTVFEIVLKDKSLGCSLGGGGRYDNMIGGFADRDEISAVGISFGLEPIFTVLENLGKAKKTTTQIYIIPINTIKQSLDLTQKLRNKGLNVDLDINERNISKNLNYANKNEIPYVIFLGEDEVKKKKVKLRNMKTGKEIFLSINDVVKKIV